MGIKIFKIVEKVFFYILILLAILLSVYIIKKIRNKDKPFMILGHYIFEVNSWSMYKEGSKESIKKGDLIFVRKQISSKYQAGDVVTYSNNDDKTTTHKIIKIDGKTITTQGISDNNTSSDEPFDVSKILGKVTLKIKGFSKFKSFITSPLGLILLALIGIAFIEGYFLLDKFLKKKQNSK